MNLDTNYTRCDNNDGSTFIDISEPNAPRYGFMFLEEGYIDYSEDEDVNDIEVRRSAPAHTVLDSEDYLMRYRESASSTVDSMTLIQMPLIDVAAIRQVWSQWLWSQ